MAGHSKWKNIQHRKERQDAKRAKLFTKISKEIYVAVKKGGENPDQNLRLRMALLKAKQANMPSDNIQRTIKKASGDVDGLTYEEITYEGYGPHGVAIMVDVLTDNRNRSAAEVRHLFSRNGGNLGESGCVAYLFERRGVIEINRDQISLDEDDLLLTALEAGAEDLQSDEKQYEVLTAPGELEQVKTKLENEGIPVAQSEITLWPTTKVTLTDEQKEEVLTLIDALEDLDDVQAVYSNVDW